MLFLGGTGYTCKGMGEVVSPNEIYRGPLESRVESRSPGEVTAIAFGGEGVLTPNVVLVGCLLCSIYLELCHMKCNI